MAELFVDLTYRGLALGRRVKLTQVRPSTGYLETAIPMPVGTALSLASEDGTAVIEATVTEVREQVTGSEIIPGMTVRPRLDGDAAKTWWQTKVESPDEVKADAAPIINIVRSKRSSALGGVPELVDDGRNTAVQDAIDPTKLGAVADKDTQVIPVIEDAPPVRDSSPSLAPIVDDGKRTVAMDAVDLAALGLDAGKSGPIPVVKDASAGGQEDDDEPDKSGPSGGKKRKKRS